MCARIEVCQRLASRDCCKIHHMRLRLLSFLLVFLLISQQPAGPCAPAPPLGARVTILEESAFIVWDSEKQIEHFIRRATFQSDAADFGFLVPTPAIPELSKLPNEVFEIEHLMAPKTIYEEQKGIRFVSAFLELFLLGAPRKTYGLRAPSSDFVDGAPPPVRIVQETSVAGYDAVVLEADNPEALNAWLKDHGYPSSPALQKWFEPYIAKKWMITAFKISGNQTNGNVSTSAVRMSFHTDQPFFPYREPEMETTNRNRSLQVLMLSKARMEGKLGENFAENWAVETKWADRLEAKDAADLLAQLKISINEKTPWLIDFEDHSSPRPGHADLYFRTSRDQASVVPPPVVITTDERVPIPVDLLLIVGIISFLFYRRRRAKA
jgi:hypothetical protein